MSKKSSVNVSMDEAKRLKHLQLAEVLCLRCIFFLKKPYKKLEEHDEKVVYAVCKIPLDEFMGM